MRRYNGYAAKIIENLSEYALMGRFSIEGVDERKLADVQDDLWSELEECVKNGQEQGLGFMVKYLPNETIEDLKNPISRGAKDFLWFVPDTIDMNQSTQPAKFLKLEDLEDWLYVSSTVHISRIRFFQPRPDPQKTDPMGWSILDGAWLGLRVLEKLQFGGMNRSQIWAVKKILTKLDENGIFTSKAELDKLKDSFFRDNFIKADSKDDYIWLEDDVNHGSELENLAIHFVSARTDIPESIFFGTRRGGVVGSETDLTLWGGAVARLQSKITPFIADILKKDYGIDFNVNDIDWNINFYTSRERELKIRLMEKKLEFIEANPEAAMNLSFSGSDKRERGGME